MRRWSRSNPYRKGASRRKRTRERRVKHHDGCTTMTLEGKTVNTKIELGIQCNWVVCLRIFLNFGSYTGYIAYRGALPGVNLAHKRQKVSSLGGISTACPLFHRKSILIYGHVESWIYAFCFTVHLCAAALNSWICSLPEVRA